MKLKIGLGVYGGSGSSSDEETDNEDLSKDRHNDSDTELKVKANFFFVIGVFNVLLITAFKISAFMIIKTRTISGNFLSWSHCCPLPNVYTVGQLDIRTL